jgi:hypothetical protein
MGVLPDFRRRRRSLRRHRGLQYWISVYGLYIFPPFIVLFTVNGFTIGWQNAYNVCALNGSPWDTSVPWLAFLLSLTGWLGIPALVGAVVGQIVVETSDNRLPIGEKMRWRNAHIPRLRDSFYDENGSHDKQRFKVPRRFVEEFVGVHAGNWRTAQNHWEMMVSAFLDTVASQNGVRLSSEDIMHKAVAEATNFLPSPVARCPYCPQPTPNQPKGDGTE